MSSRSRRSCSSRSLTEQLPQQPRLALPPTARRPSPPRDRRSHPPSESRVTRPAPPERPSSTPAAPSRSRASPASARPTDKRRRSRSRRPACVSGDPRGDRSSRDGGRSRPRRGMRRRGQQSAQDHRNGIVVYPLFISVIERSLVAWAWTSSGHLRTRSESPRRHARDRDRRRRRGSGSPSGLHGRSAATPPIDRGLPGLTSPPDRPAGSRETDRDCCA